MSKPKAPKESAEQRAARLAEEERIRVLQARADAEEAAAGRQILTRRTRQVLRLYGARRAMAVGGGGGAPTTISGGAGGSSFPLGYGGGGGSGGGGSAGFFGAMKL